MAECTPDSFKILLGKLVKTPEYFTPEDLELSLHHLFTPDAALPAQTGAFLAALHIGRSTIVGTGGDGHNTFNVSTTAAVVAAGAGARVIKASTSSSGSADLLQSLDCLFTAPSQGTSFPISKMPFTFILAPHYHPALAMIAPYRKSLPFRTLFNVLGPLINPARPRGMVLGVAERELGPTFVQSLHEGGVERALVVCGAEGLDEISCAGNTYAWQLVDGKITETTLHPDLFGLSTHPLTSVAGGTPTENAETFKALLNSGNDIPESLTPVLHFVLLNASALLVVAGLASDFKEGVALAMNSITSGSAWDAFVVFRNASRESVKETNEVEKKEI
ncbi:glycosyl transferase [Suillus discolor]|uniref:Glycosyl transferase n=1 Tax=Suillus discolor TaxID=1912936 RepID=A0A9P7JY15_9AGAM|nr:glycosyl transferase [Suillus discolor]KAG2114360.1 glycosyl transferase [Suillus discolor]